jgi:hypothetical protein
LIEETLQFKYALYESGRRNEPTRRNKITEIFIETQQEVCGAFEIPWLNNKYQTFLYHEVQLNTAILL